MKRSSGVLMHITSLFGEYSIGSFGQEAKEWIDFLADCGFSWWQVLPFCPIDECNSPYQSHSAFGGNPYLIDLPRLWQQGLLTGEELERQRQQTPYRCEYTRLYHNRLELLRTAAGRAQNRQEIIRWAEQHPYLQQFCRFMSLKEANQNHPWQEWTVQTGDEDTFFLWQFIQFHFMNQWQEIKEYANQKGIRILGDIPIYVALDSADVWGNREQFWLDERGMPGAVAGVPPDYFSPEGQHWGNPLYRWDVMEKTGYQWWCDRMKHMLKMFDGVRLDHFRGFEAYWAIPAPTPSAKNGSWQKGPGSKLIEKFRQIAGDRLIVAEDLGEITPQVEQLVQESGFPGMRVIQFGFLNEGDSPHRPHHYCNNTVAYTGTHDNNTLLGFLWELEADKKKTMLEYCGYTDPDWERGFDSIVRTLFASSAGLVILPVQDLLKYGSDTRLNIPGKADGNWQYRMTREQLQSIDRSYWRRLNQLYSREL